MVVSLLLRSETPTTNYHHHHDDALLIVEDHQEEEIEEVSSIVQVESLPNNGSIAVAPVSEQQPQEILKRTPLTSPRQEPILVGGTSTSSSHQASTSSRILVGRAASPDRNVVS